MPSQLHSAPAVSERPLVCRSVGNSKSFRLLTGLQPAQRCTARSERKCRDPLTSVTVPLQVACDPNEQSLYQPFFREHRLPVRQPDELVRGEPVTSWRRTNASLVARKLIKPVRAKPPSTYRPATGTPEHCQSAALALRPQFFEFKW